jgi:hypothetical protein
MQMYSCNRWHLAGIILLLLIGSIVGRECHSYISALPVTTHADLRIAMPVRDVRQPLETPPPGGNTINSVTLHQRNSAAVNMYSPV